jgi:hypothetical protein
VAWFPNKPADVDVGAVPKPEIEATFAAITAFRNLV